jgi:hypothetical protein
LNIPDVPIRRDEEEESVSVEKAAAAESEGKDSVVKENEESKEPARG